jgi:hypothetical protein
MAVNRNIDRFSADFMVQLTAGELRSLIFHFGTSSWGGTRKPPRAFTEQGVALISSILRKHGYPPDKQEKATQTVLEQAEVLSELWSVA